MSDNQQPEAPAPGRRPHPRPIRSVDDLPEWLLGTLILVLVGGLFLLALRTVPSAIDWVQSLDWQSLEELLRKWADTVNGPVRAYLKAHTVGLPLTAADTYLLWQGTGLGALLVGWATGAAGARLTWLAHGAATIAMVHAQAPAAGRDVAVGVTVLAWTALSTLALRGLRLR